LVYNANCVLVQDLSLRLLGKREVLPEVLVQVLLSVLLAYLIVARGHYTIQPGASLHMVLPHWHGRHRHLHRLCALVLQKPGSPQRSTSSGRRLSLTAFGFSTTASMLVETLPWQTPMRRASPWGSPRLPIASSSPGRLHAIVGFVVEIFAYDIRYSKDPRFTPHCTKEISTSETSNICDKLRVQYNLLLHASCSQRSRPLTRRLST